MNRKTGTPQDQPSPPPLEGGVRGGGVTPASPVDLRPDRHAKPHAPPSNSLLKGGRTGAALFLQAALLALIFFYRHTLSALMGRTCRFLPTCSQYAEEAIRRHGAARGSRLAFKRLCKCHPWGDGGCDPVP